MAETSQPDPTRWVPTAASAIGAISALAGTLTYVAHLVRSNAYRQFGLQPEDVGLTEGRLLAQSVGVFGFFAATLGSLALVGVIQFRLVRATEPERLAAEPLTTAARIRYLTVAALPIPTVAAALWLLRAGVAETAFVAAALAFTMGIWSALSAGPGRRRQGFFIGAGVMTVAGVVASIAAVARPRVATGFLLFAFVITSVFLSDLQQDPRWKRAHVTNLRSTLLAVSLCAAVATSGTFQVWWLAAWIPAMAGWYLAVVIDKGWGATLDERFPGWRLIALFTTAAIVIGASAVWVADRADGAARDALQIKAGRPTEGGPLEFFPVEATPARIVPLDGDPLGVCTKSVVARLLGRNGDTAYVLFRPPTPGQPEEGYVLPLPSSAYTVATGVERPGLCEPL